MPKLDLEAIRARAEAATKGPWVHVPRTLSEEHGLDVYEITEFYEDDPPIAETTVHGTVNDAAFIAHARTDIPDLLDEINRLESENDKLMEQLHLCGGG